MCGWKKLGELFSFTNNKNLLLALTSATCISMHNKFAGYSTYNSDSEKFCEEHEERVTYVLSEAWPHVNSMFEFLVYEHPVVIPPSVSSAVLD